MKGYKGGGVPGERCLIRCTLQVPVRSMPMEDSLPRGATQPWWAGWGGFPPASGGRESHGGARGRSPPAAKPQGRWAAMGGRRAPWGAGPWVWGMPLKTQLQFSKTLANDGHQKEASVTKNEAPVQL